MFVEMLAAVALCTGPEYWTVDHEARACPLPRQRRRCECSEYMIWDPSPDAERYEIERCTVESSRVAPGEGPTACEIVGTTTDTVWYFVDDRPLRIWLEHALFRYRVRAVTGELRSEWTRPVLYRRNPWPTEEAALQDVAAASASAR